MSENIPTPTLAEQAHEHALQFRALIHTKKTFLKQAIKYGTVGAFSTLIDISLLYVFVDLVHLHLLLGAALSFCVAAANGYFLNRIWTFRSDNPNVAHQLAKFLTCGVIGLILNNTLLWLFTSLGLWYIFAKLIIVWIVVFWNYLANRVWTFGNLSLRSTVRKMFEK